MAGIIQDPTQDQLNQYVVDFENLILTDAPVYNGQNSVKTNFQNIFNYLKTIKNIFSIIINYLKYLKTEINAQDIVTNVTQNLMVNKINFDIQQSTPVNNVQLFTIQGILYKVNRTRDNEFEITKDTNDWIVDNLIVDVKTDQGEKIYPIIKTLNNKVNIIFSEIPTVNFKIIVL